VVCSRQVAGNLVLQSNRVLFLGAKQSFSRASRGKHLSHTNSLQEFTNDVPNLVSGARASGLSVRSADIFATNIAEAHVGPLRPGSLSS
jgi:hypothetical protein